MAEMIRIDLINFKVTIKYEFFSILNIIFVCEERVIFFCDKK